MLQLRVTVWRMTRDTAVFSTTFPGWNLICDGAPWFHDVDLMTILQLFLCLCPGYCQRQFYLLSLRSCGLRQGASGPGSEIISELTTYWCDHWLYAPPAPPTSIEFARFFLFERSSVIECLSDPAFQEKDLFWFHWSKTVYFRKFESALTHTHP